MNPDIKNTPWECDDITFLPGDWEISRASAEGKYQYSFLGIASCNLATAADLVKWKMAKFLPQELLSPWDDDEITFVDGVEILRDFVKSSGKEKRYLIHDSGSRVELLRVNKYYLIKEKLAVASDKLKQTIAEKKVKNKQYNSSCEPWPGDDIFILDPVGGETIARGSSTGLYRVKDGSTIRNWTASVLLSEHRAIAGYDVRLAELSSRESTSMREYYEATDGFWRSGVVTFPSFKEIAHIWCSLQYNHFGTVANALLDELNRTIDYCNALVEKFADFSDKANELDEAIKTVQPKVIELENLYNFCKVFQTKTVADDFSSFPEALKNYVEARSEIDAIYEDISKSFAEVEEILSLLKRDVSKVQDIRFFPHDVLPREFADYLQSKEDECSSVLHEARDFSPYESRLSDLRATVELIETVIAQMDVASIESSVGKITARKATLDSLRETICIDDKFSKKPGLFAKPNKEDGIRYKTGISVKNKSAGQYVVTYSAGSIELSVLELIYLGLAEKI